MVGTILGAMVLFQAPHKNDLKALRAVKAVSLYLIYTSTEEPWRGRHLSEIVKERLAKGKVKIVTHNPAKAAPLLQVKIDADELTRYLVSVDLIDFRPDPKDGSIASFSMPWTAIRRLQTRETALEFLTTSLDAFARDWKTTHRR